MYRPVPNTMSTSYKSLKIGCDIQLKKKVYKITQ